MKFVIKIFVLIMLISLSGCATLDRFIDPPRLTISGIEVLPTQGFQPRFAVHLNILNPNPIAIPIAGMSYEISLNNYELFNGATSDLSSIPAYEEASVRLELGVDVLRSVGFISELLNGDVQSVNYSIASEIKVSGIFQPISVTETGVVQLTR